MKKFFVASLMVLLIATSSFAFQWSFPAPDQQANNSALGEYTGGGQSYSYDEATSYVFGGFHWDWSWRYGWHLDPFYVPGDDGAMAGAGSGGTYYNKNWVTGSQFGGEFGGGKAWGSSTSHTFAFDMGLASVAGGSAETTVAAVAGGMAGGINYNNSHYYGGTAGDPGFYIKNNGQGAGETVKYFPNGHPENQSEWTFLGTHYSPWGVPVVAGSFSRVNIGGGAGQGNWANEIDFDNAAAGGGNSSSASFVGEAWGAQFDIGQHGAFAISGAALIGGASTEGTTFVKVDPFGNDRSAFGITKNTADAYVIGGPNAATITQVEGQGQMQTGAQIQTYNHCIDATTGAAFAQADSRFGYSGTQVGGGVNFISGSGFATNQSNVSTWSNPYTNTNGFTASSSGASGSSVNFNGGFLR
jgi:hypothetical protein